MPVNELYLAVLPLIHLNTGLTEQTLTLLPDRKLATEFSAEEVDNYVTFFQSRADNYLLGGQVQRYECFKEPSPNGHVIVRVMQHVG